MSVSTWSRTGSSEKAQQSQTIKILLKSMQYLAENAASTAEDAAAFLKIASPVIGASFNPSTKVNMNEQVNSLLGNLGWKNSQISLKSADAIEMILGSNRYLDQNSDNIPGIKLLVRVICVSMGNHILGRQTDALVNFDINNNTYTVNIQATQAFKPDMKAEIQTKMTSIDSEHSQSADQTEKARGPRVDIQSGTYDTAQIILPIIDRKLPLLKLQNLLKDVTEEFSRSWFNMVPELSAKSDDGNLAILLTFLIQKADEKGNDVKDIGSQIGNYFADAIKNTFPNEEAVTPEIIEGSSVGSIIRDIKARSFCTLTSSQTCGVKIGGPERKFCDLSMGIWSGVLTNLTDKEYAFTGFYEAGKRDPYCLMEFSVN